MNSKRRPYVQPPYNTAGRPDFLSMEADPRVSFTGVSTRVFPLKASMNTLQAFCDNYFNFPDDNREMKKSQGNFFRAAVPYVFFQMINYGTMAIESQNLGWFAQNEILFLVPLEWYKVDESGQLYFYDWAMVCPFIFVDNDMSLTTGRETYGWSKVRGWLDWVPTTWTTNPQRPQRLLNMRTNVFTRLFEGEEAEPRTLIEVTQQQQPTIGPSLFTQRNIFNPFWNIPERVLGGIALSGNLFEVISNLPVLGYQRRDLSSLTRMSMKALSNMRAVVPWLNLTAPEAPGRPSDEADGERRFSPNLYYNQLTLKQFRDAADPDYACYQGVVNSRVSVEHYYDFGLLGAANAVGGDLSGGFTLKVHDYPEQTIVETLGIEVAERIVHADHTPIALIKPVMPFWMSCDLNYDTGETVAWRGKTSPTWDALPLERDAGKGNMFNTTRGAAIQEIPGPFNHPNATIRVLPLLADKKKLEQYCDDYLNVLDKEAEFGVDGNSFEPWGSYVYMIVTTYGIEEPYNKSWADRVNFGQFAKRDIAFCVPVKWMQVTATGAELKNVGFLTPYVFGNSSRQVITEREINGRPMIFSDIFCDDDSWLRTSGPLAKRSFAKLKTLLIPALNVGQPAQMRDLIEVTERQPLDYDDHVSWAVVRANWEPELETDRKLMEDGLEEMEDSKKKDIIDLFENVCAKRHNLNFLSLKQYRGTERADRACYQALVLLQKKIESIFWAAGTNEPKANRMLHVLIHRYPTLPIVETLGLKVKATDSKGASVIDFLEPIRPFYMRVSLREELGKLLCSRTNSMRWVTGEVGREGYGEREVASRNVHRTGQEGGRGNEEETPSAFHLDSKTRDLIEQIHEPQAVIEMLLKASFGWGGPPREKSKRDRSESGDESERDEAETDDESHLDVSRLGFWKHFGHPINKNIYKANRPAEEDDEKKSTDGEKSTDGDK